ncbi:hypothetical protein BJQ90_00629 [Arthrobacter sp. SO3]|nr:hypothetical protein [Arthrobacter sp. SO3]
MSAISSPGGYSIYLLDILSVALILVSVLNYRYLGHSIRSSRLLWAMLTLLFVAALARGIGSLGPNAAVNEARGFVTLASATLWALSLDWSSTRITGVVRKYSLWLGWMLTLVATYHALRFGVGGASEFVDADGLDQTGRVLVSGQAMVLGLCAIVSLHIWVETRRSFYLFSTLAFSAIVLVAQHRSVWIAIAAAWIAYALFGQRHKRNMTLTVVIVAAWSVALVVASGVANGLLDQLQQSSENTSTYDARTWAWQYLIDEAINKGPETVLFGAPFGTGFGRIEANGQYVTFQPHNIYVSIFLRLGVIGLVASALLVTGYLVKNLRERNNLAISLQIAIILYGWAYGPTWYFFVFAAVSMVGVIHFPASDNTSRAVPRAANSVPPPQSPSARKMIQ